jgi:hypothetical protein
MTFAPHIQEALEHCKESRFPDARNVLWAAVKENGNDRPAIRLLAEVEDELGNKLVGERLLDDLIARTPHQPNAGCLKKP